MSNIKYNVLHKNYEIIGENELLHQLLRDRGVDNPNKLLHLDESVLYDGMMLKNMDRGLNMLHWHINNKSRIHIIADVDADGVTSMVSMYKYIKNIDNDIQITYSMNEDKKHGIVLKKLEPFDFDLLIVPDAGTNDVEETRILYEKYDIDTLIIDHHQIEKENKNGIVINCQDDIYPNPTLSGAGVVYKFIKEYDKKYKYNYADICLDIIAVGMIADQMDLRNYETRYIALKGLKNINNKFLKEFILKNKKTEEDIIDFEFIGWKVTPYINAVTRVGSPEEKIDLIKAFLEIDEPREYQPRRKNKNDPKPPIEIQTLQKAMIRKCTNIKSRQDKLVTQSMEVIQEEINKKHLDNNKIIMTDATNVLEKTFTGLVANKLASIYKRPVIILKKMENKNNKIIYGGSFRNYRLFPIHSLFDFLNSLNTFSMLAGHPNAGGLNINNENVESTLSKANEELKDIPIEDVYWVDYEIPVGRLKEKHIAQVGKWSSIWGNTLSKPLFAITDITIPIESIQLLGDKRNLIKFEKQIGKNKIVFVKKFASEHVYNTMTMKKTKGLSRKSVDKVKLDIIGEFVINKWNDVEFPQIEIIDFNVSKAKDFTF